jgi:Na+-driven multidrug efflux pump
MPAVGISIAAASLVGKSLGEKDVEKAHAIGQLSGFMSIAWGVVMGIIFFTLPQPLLKIFTSEMDLITLGIPVMAFLAINQPMLNYTIAMSGALRGAGDTKIVMRLTAIRLWSVFLPGTYIAIVHLNSGVAGLWYAEILSFVIFSTILYKRFNSKAWALIEF